MKKIRRILSKAVLSAFVSLIICIAVWILSGDIQNWMKVVIYAITFAILLPPSESQQTIPAFAHPAVGSYNRNGSNFV